MADLTADVALRFRYDKALFIEKWVCDNSANATIYRGNPMIIDNSADTLYVRPFLSTVTLQNAGRDIFVGIALEGKTVKTTDTETDNVIEVAGPGSIVGFPSSMHSLTDANVGVAVGFNANNGTVSAVVIAGAADKCPMGWLYRVENGYAYVKLQDSPVLTAF
jgi:hypothetical protein